MPIISFTSLLLFPIYRIMGRSIPVLVLQVYHCFPLTEYRTKASIRLCKDNFLWWKWIGMVRNLHNHVIILIWEPSSFSVDCFIYWYFLIWCFRILCLFGGYLLAGAVYRYFFLHIRGIDVSRISVFHSK